MSTGKFADFEIGVRYAAVEQAAALHRTLAPRFRLKEPSQASRHDGSFSRSSLTDIELGRVLGIAASCFIALGYAAASIETIANQSCYSRRFIYYHFPTKEDLFRKSIQYTWCKSASSTIRFDETEISDPEIGLTQIGHKLSAFWTCRETIGLMRMAILEQRQFPKLMHSLVDAGINRGLSATKNYIQRLTDIGVFINFTSLDIAASQFIGSLLEIVLWSRVFDVQSSEPTELDVTVIVGEAVKTFLCRYNCNRLTDSGR